MGSLLYRSESNPRLAHGWTLQRLTPPSRLFGANGLRTGADGRIYVAQVAGSQVSAIDVDTGAIEAISPMGGDIVGPDDLVFDDEGNLFVTEVTENRVSMRSPNGTVKVLQGDMPVANPITYHKGRLIAGELRFGGRIMELDRNGGAPRIILDNVPLVNAFEVGPDDKLYFPVIGKNEIWRVDLDGGAPEVVARNLAVPNSVKFDAAGFIVSTQAASGQVLRIDPRNGDRTVLADIRPGLDNCTFVGHRLFVSSISGQITEIIAPGAIRALLPDGLQWPMGLAVSEDGTLFVADGGFCYTLQPGGVRQLAGMHFTRGYPGFTRGVAAETLGQWIVSTANGQVARFCPARDESQVLASGYDKLMDVAVAPGGALIVAESGRGRALVLVGEQETTLADGLDCPVGVAVGPGGACYVTESGAGRVLCFSNGKRNVVLDGLQQPEGIALSNGRLYIVDVMARELIEHDLASSARRTIAADLPVGAPPGAVRKYLGGLGNMTGPMVCFSGIAVGADGTLYLSADAEGSVIALRSP